MSRVRLLSVGFILALSAAAATGVAPPARPAPLQTIALSPVGIPDGLDDPGPVRALFDSLLAAELARAGFTVVPSHEAGGLWKRFVDSAGFTVVPSHEAGGLWKRFVDSVQGFYSALTGELVEEKYRAVMGGTLRELKDRFHADAWLRPEIDVVAVDFEGGKARWDGTDEGVGSGTSGTVPALSLAVVALDMDGKEIYTGRGGIQVLRKGFKDVSREKLFKDAKRNLKALHLAIDSLLVRRSPS